MLAFLYYLNFVLHQFYFKASLHKKFQLVTIPNLFPLEVVQNFNTANSVYYGETRLPDFRYLTHTWSY